MMILTPRHIATSLLMLSLLGCQSMYYGTMEKFGIEKRDILVDRVDEAREAQQDAKQQFESALDQFLAVTNYQGGELEDQYRKLKGEYEDSLDRAEAVRERIGAVEDVAEDLFAEWKAELTQYQSADLRRSSERQLNATRSSYNQLIRAMKRAESKLDPVLGAFNDRVLYLKHNLNAQAIAALKSDRAAIESNINALIRDMNKSIAEADRFISAMTAP
ncbi:MAG: DNA repair protein [Gammaproteobacteria bacterium SG8_47]|nr:MAG: DNA repair protein [Gammaproteobacteria bacterium SG8_47]